MTRHPSLEPRRIRASVDVVPLFRVLAARFEDVFWLDGGAGAADGWSVLGVGERDERGPGDVMLDAGAPAPSDGPPFRGGWVGWLDYESGAAAAGAPAARSEGGPAWLHVSHAIAVDHARGEVWTLGTEDVIADWLHAAAVSASDLSAVHPEPSSSIAHVRHTPRRIRRPHPAMPRRHPRRQRISALPHHPLPGRRIPR
ncbi:hypothetical protein [Microbacterium murale]|uniref:hypothetical protein n=1 Tax=Microbacterium murale TaxID=1081040 RepID=UPI0027D8BCD2|nr:hypothetical protein [Microbacterium murale]